MNAERLMLLGGVGAFLLTVYWVRVRDLREKYALLWLGLASTLLLAGLFPEPIEELATHLRLAYPSLVLYVALVLIYCFAFGASVTHTRLYRHNIRLMQELSFLERRVRELERQNPGVRGQESGVRGQGSGIRGQESGVRNQESGISDTASPTPDS